MNDNDNDSVEDVIILDNTSLQGQELQQAITTLVSLSSGPYTPEQAKLLLSSPGSKLVRKSVAREEAQRFLGLLRSAGIRCNSRPAKAAPTLTLAQVEKTKDCGKCGHKHPLVAGEPEPTICVKCGIVFAKYATRAKEIAEREQIEKRLKAAADAKRVADAKQREDEEAEDRRRRIENEIRKQLGIPQIINTRGRLVGTAIAVNLFGIALGMAAIGAYDLFTNGDTGKANTQQHGVSMGALAPQVATNPGIMAQMAVSQILADKSDAADMPIATPGDFDPDSLPVQNSSPPFASTSGSTAASPFLTSKLADFKTDTEWDQHLLTQTDAMVTQGTTTDAVKLLDQVREPKQRFAHGARLVGQLWNKNRSAEAEAVYHNLSNAGERLTGGPSARIESLCTLARQLNASGRKVEAEALLQKVRVIADTIIEPADKAMANSEIAALLTVLGRAEDARSLFSLAVKSLEDAPDLVRQLSAIARIAPGYAKAGYRASALHLLEDAIRKSDSLTDPKSRSQTLGQLAVVSARLADMQMAMMAVQLIPATFERDQTIYHILTQAILSERITQAIDVAKYIKTPTYQALAFGFLALSQQQQVNYQGLATEFKAKAHIAVTLIESTGEKSAVMSELGRFAARSSDVKQATEYFKESKRLAESLDTVPEQDRVFAILAANKAQALQFAEAQEDLAKVTDANMRRSIAADITNWQQTAKIGL